MGEKISITGLLLPHDWDEDGRLSIVSVLTPDEGEYVLDLGQCDQELFRFVSHQAELIGTMQPLREDGYEVMEVEKYRILSDSSQAFWEETTWRKVEKRRQRMKTMKMMVALLGVLTILSLSAAPVWAADDAFEAVTVTGKVEAADKDEDGYYTMVKVGGYLISDFGEGAQLLDMVDQNVTVKGEAYEEDGTKMLDVTEITVND